ncbi:DUF4845 domain-containing protein [Pseudomonas subflava]|uniref:DUF4845 domain-containing protein n=1 Tax=Pseudomonas subflava TaxID=2952933 RepID=UPI00207B03A4|nr:DUF4845 domain-containing protein [Pseudomonas subflava]
MTFARSQKGMSLLGWVVVLTIVAFFASTAFKMLPHYMDFWSLEKAIESVENDRALGVVTVADFYNHVEKSMQINGVRELDSKEILDINLEGEDFLVHLQYEKREPLIENLDLVAKFDKEFRIRSQ